AAADRNQLVLSKVEIGKPVVNLAGNAVVLPSQAEIPGQAARHLEIILNESVEGTHSKTVRHRKLRLYCRRGIAGQKCSQRWKRDPAARSCVEVVIPETAEFPSQFHRMPAMNPRKRVVVLKCRVAAALWESIDASKIHNAGNQNVWKDGRACCEPEILRIQFAEHVRNELDMDAIRSRAQLVGESRAEYMRLAQR